MKQVFVTNRSVTTTVPLDTFITMGSSADDVHFYNGKYISSAPDVPR